MKRFSKKSFVMFFACLLVCVLSFSLIAGTFNTSIYKVEAARVSQIREVNDKVTIIEDALSDYLEGQKASGKKKSIKDDRKELFNAFNEVAKQYPAIVSISKDFFDGGDFDTANLVNTILDTASGVAACFVPWGTLVSIGIGLVRNVTTAVLGGTAETDELKQMEGRLNQQFNSMQGSLAEVKGAIQELSNKIDKQTDEIINAVTTALDNQSAKNILRNFTLSGEGNFSYREFKNYIYGNYSIDNPFALTAYKSILDDAINNGMDNDELGYYYNELYTAISDNIDILFDYIVGGNDMDSIVMSYYKAVSSSEKYNEGQAIIDTIKYADDLFATLQAADDIVLICNDYQYRQIIKNEYKKEKSQRKIIEDVVPEGLFYDCNGTHVTVGNIKKMQGIIETREKNAKIAIIKNIVDICGLDDAYYIENEGENAYQIKANKDKENGVNKDTNIILMDMYALPSVCELFGVETDDFYYSVNGKKLQGNGTFKMPEGKIEATLKYKLEDVENDLFTLKFTTEKVGQSEELDGRGTKADPYKISTLSEFDLINNDLSACYILTADINGEGTDVTKNKPIGCREIDGHVKFSEFNGEFDGGGHTIKNINFSTTELYSGLFAKLGVDGVIKNVKIENVNVKTTINEAPTTKTNVYSSVLVGENHGVIEKVEINNCKVDFTLTNTELDRTINVYVGGITGYNDYLVEYIKVINTKVYADSSHSFAGQDTSKNKHFVYVGGIVGYDVGFILMSYVDSQTKIKAQAISYNNPTTTVNAYVEAYAGGIVGRYYLANTNVSERIQDVYVDSVVNTIIEKCFADIKHESSLWTDFRYNVHSQKDAYVPKEKPEDINKIKTTKEIVLNAIDNYDVNGKIEYSIVNGFDNKTILCNAGGVLDLKNSLLITFNGELVSNFSIDGLYGFDSTNTSFNDVKDETVKVLLSIQNEFGNVYFVLPINVEVNKNHIAKTKIEGLKEKYYIYNGNSTNTQFDFEGVKIHQFDVFGEECGAFYLQDGNFEVSGIDFNSLTKIDEPRTLQIHYISNYKDQEVVAEWQYYVLCEHEHNASVLNETSEQKKSSTCDGWGYTSYTCNECGETVKINYTSPTGIHTYINENKKEATCYECGNSGIIKCKDCGKTLQEGGLMPQLKHEYTYDFNQYKSFNSETYHKCTHEEGDNAYEPHQFEIIYLYKEIEKDGQMKYQRWIKYHCAACDYEKEEEDANFNVQDATTMPIVYVSDGYVLSGGDEVTLFVQVKNFKDKLINGANFGIRYDEKLQLVSVEDGPLLSDSIINKSKEVLFGYNFIWGDFQSFTTVRKNSKGNDYDDGTGSLLKLVFKVPSYAVLTDSFEINVVYGLRDDGKGGFYFDNAYQQIQTFSGTISVVKHLPGDVNGDTVVDLLDAFEIANYNIEASSNINKKYADVNLDGTVNLDDVIWVLQSTMGNRDLLNPEFLLLLDYNDGTGRIDRQTVSVWGEDNTRNEFNLPVPTRKGYKFLGWYTTINGGEKRKTGDFVSRNKDQKVQTLYARWELNQITFNNGVDDKNHNFIQGDMPTIRYYDGYIFDERAFDCKYKQEYSITFVDKGNGQGDIIYGNKEFAGKLTFNFKQWYYIDNGEKVYVNIKDLDLSQKEIGNITLYPEWDDGTFTYPKFDNSNERESHICAPGHWQDYGYDIEWYIDERTYSIPYNIETLKEQYNKISGITLYGKFIPKTFTVVFKTNDDEGQVNTKVKNNPIPPITECNIQVLKNFNINGVFERDGYTLLKWYNEKDNKDYELNDEFDYIEGVESGEEYFLQAVWEENTYTLDFDLISNITKNYGLSLSGCNMDSKSDLNYYAEVLLEHVLPPKIPGFVFDHWSLSIDGDKTEKVTGADFFKEGFIKESGKSKCIYAVWKVKQYTIKFNLNEEAIKTKDKTIIDFKGMQVNSIDGIKYNYVDGTTLPTLKTFNEYYIIDGWKINETIYTNIDPHSVDFGSVDFGEDKCECELEAIASWGPNNCTHIETYDQLNKIRNNPGDTYVLLNDIDCKGNDWEPIETFSGTLDGDGHCIYNFQISRVNVTIGASYNLAFIINNMGNIKNLTFGNDKTYEGYDNYSCLINIVCTAAAKVHSQLEVAVIANNNYGQINNCTIKNINLSAKIIDVDNAKNTYIYVGGVCVINKIEGEIENSNVILSSIKAEVYPSQNQSGENNGGFLGGIVSINENIINKCTVSENILSLKVPGYGYYHHNVFSETIEWADLYCYLGGFVGQSLGGSITDCIICNNNMTASTSDETNRQQWYSKEYMEIGFIIGKIEYECLISGCYVLSGDKIIKKYLKHGTTTTITEEIQAFIDNDDCSKEGKYEYVGSTELSKGDNDIYQFTKKIQNKYFTSDTGEREKTINPIKDYSLDTFGEYINPNFDKETLIENGFTKLKVIVSLDIAEINDGYQYITIWANDEELNSQIIEHVPGKLGTSWDNHQFSFELPLNKLPNDCTFGFNYSAYGNDADAWKLGRTIVSVEVQ